MEIIVASVIAVLVGSGVYLTLRARTFPVILGITLLSYGVNLMVFISGRLVPNQAPIVSQSLVLTAIVIGFAMTAFLVVLALRGQSDLGTDHVDGQRDGED